MKMLVLPKYKKFNNIQTYVVTLTPKQQKQFSKAKKETYKLTHDSSNRLGKLTSLFTRRIDPIEKSTKAKNKRPKELAERNKKHERKHKHNKELVKILIKQSKDKNRKEQKINKKEKQQLKQRKNPSMTRKSGKFFKRFKNVIKSKEVFEKYEPKEKKFKLFRSKPKKIETLFIHKPDPNLEKEYSSKLHKFSPFKTKSDKIYVDRLNTHLDLRRKKSKFDLKKKLSRKCSSGCGNQPNKCRVDHEGYRNRTAGGKLDDLNYKYVSWYYKTCCELYCWLTVMVLVGLAVVMFL